MLKKKIPVLYGYQRGQVGERDGLGVGDWHVYTTTFKTYNQQGLTV